MITLKGGLSIGNSCPTRVNCNVGCNKFSDYEYEKKKLLFIKEKGILPDMMMDLSLVNLPTPLFYIIRDDLGLPFGTVLSYHGFKKEQGFSWEVIKNNFLRLCNAGISFITIHFTADSDLLSKARIERQIPFTSRGGGIVLYDTIINRRTNNIFRKHIDDLIEIALQYDVVISLGSTFRPATTLDACDQIHIEETKRQLAICKYLQKRGVKTMIENVGHISLDKLTKHAELLKESNAPIMPLGPLPTDTAENMDHIANAVGGAYGAFIGIAHVINSVTRFEHSQSLIIPEVTLEAIRSAKIAAQIADLSRNIPNALIHEKRITDKRKNLHSCISDGTLCVRCSNVCPLKILPYD
jgi:phosphomethylpyrimidine synthase